MGFSEQAGNRDWIEHGIAGTRPLPYSRDAHNGNGNGGLRAVGANRAPEMQETTRISNGLKEFLWNLEGLGRGTLLDLARHGRRRLAFHRARISRNIG